MRTLNREELINKIVTSRLKNVLIPSVIFGKLDFVKTTKHDIVERIKKEFEPGADTSLKFRVRSAMNAVIIEPAQYAADMLATERTESNSQAAGNSNEATPAKRKPGRPKGSKNQPKQENLEQAAA